MGILHDTTTPATPSEESRKFIGTVYKCCHSIFVQTGTEQQSGLSQHFITQTVNYNHVISTINFPLIILRLEQYHQYGRDYNWLCGPNGSVQHLRPHFVVCGEDDLSVCWQCWEQASASGAVQSSSESAVAAAAAATCVMQLVAGPEQLQL